MKFLKVLMATVTQTPRQDVVEGVDFRWSNNSHIYNAFRYYEMTFGRREGIRLESTTEISPAGIVTTNYSFESKVVSLELALYKALKPKPTISPIQRLDLIKYYGMKAVPVMALVLALVYKHASPFLAPFITGAIAFDVIAEPGIGGSGPYTWTHNATGSNLILFVMTAPNAAATGVTAKKGGSATAMTQVGTNQYTNPIIGFWSILAPDTGATSNIVATAGGAGGFNGRSATYSGVAQVALDSHAQGTGNSTSATATTTVVASNCWLVGCFFNNATGTVSAGGSTTVRGTGGNQGDCIADSNATVGTGSQSISISWSGATDFTWNVTSIAAVAAAVVPGSAFLLNMI